MYDYENSRWQCGVLVKSMILIYRFNGEELTVNQPLL